MKFLAAAMMLAFASPAFAGDKIAEAIADPTRLEEQRARDEGRKPADILKLSGVKKGDKVADLAAGSGYYTALLSRIVGEKGKVYAVDPTLIMDTFPGAAKTFPGYIEAFDFWRIHWQETLLHFHGQIQFLLESHSLLEL